MTLSKNTKYAGSANDLPFVRQLKSELKALSAINLLVGSSEVDRELHRIKEELQRIISIVDRFYELLGEHNWIFSNVLNLNKAEEIINAQTIEEAEQKIVSYLKENDVLSVEIRKLNRFQDMRPRMDLLLNARKDFLEGRYYSVVLVLIAVMDGFVNDIEKIRRRGLHARCSEEMYQDDCVAAMLAGLPSVQKVFTKAVKKRNDEPVFDIYRNGIMHGMVTNFDNEIIAAKAWLMLFGVCDWADGILNTSNDSTQEEMTIEEALKKMLEMGERNRLAQEYLDSWNSHNVNLDDPACEEDKVLLLACESFLNAWKDKNYGKLSRYFPNYSKQPIGQMAKTARLEYSRYPIADFEIKSVEREAPAVAYLNAAVCAENLIWGVRLRWVRLNNGGFASADCEPGEWKLMRYLIDPFPTKEV